MIMLLKKHLPAGRRVTAAMVCALLVSGCATTDGQSDIGKFGGAAAGAALGSLIGGGKGNTIAMVGGALLGGFAGNELYDKPKESENRAHQVTAREQAYDQELAYERQSQLQHARVQQEIQKQSMHDNWRNERSGQDDSSPSNEVGRAQRLLRGLGYYNGHVDGVVGSGTTRAVKTCQRENGLAVNGQITPALINKMQSQM